MLRANVNDNKNIKEINKVLAYIHNNFCEKIDNKTIAELIGYHSYYVNRLMKKATGTTLRQYVIDCRINAAKKCLTETDLSILEVSEKCGYKNFSNFSNDFKRKCGISPSVYRQNTKRVL